MSQELTKIQLGMISAAAQAALQGQNGATGASGASGMPGPAGPQGIQGSVGATGPIGATGVSVTGATGPQGVQGPVGASGLQGIQGEQGATGEVGPSGASGIQGIQGVQGPSGLQGGIGSTGATGQQGATGLGDKYQTTSTTSIVVGNGAKTLTVEAGLAYTQNQPILISETANGAHMHGVVTSYNKITGELVADVSTHTGSGTYAEWSVNLEGAVGAVGATGAVGASGIQGPSGVPGIDGQQGATGQVGPSGAQGIQGPSGLQGIQGEQGATGQVGPSGASGLQGGQGATGEVGPSGAQGVQGVAGEVGPSGLQGVQGATGATGIGATGATGAAGDKYTTASTDSLSLTTGSKSLTVQTGLALSVGQQVILAYDSTHLMQGAITSYTALTGALEVNVTSVLAGTGTYASWTVSLSGAVGQVGATGATGPQAPVLGGGILSPQFVGNGSATEFGPISGWDGPQNDEAGYLVYLDGVFQRPDEVNGGFSITGTTEANSKIVFPSAVADGTKIDVLAIQVTGAKGATGATGAGGGGGGGRGQAWDSAVTYAIGDLVTQNNIGWVSLTEENINNDPSTSPTQWERVKSNAVQLQGIGVSESGPTTGQVLAFDGTSYAPADVDAAKIKGVSVSATTPASDQVLAFDGTNYSPKSLSKAGQIWDISVSYKTGDIVSYNNIAYISQANDNIGYAPGSSTSWQIAKSNAASIQGTPIETTSPLTGNGLRFDGTNWTVNGEIIPSWNSGVNYNAGDVVAYGGKIFIAKGSSYAVTPLVDSSSAQYWAEQFGIFDNTSPNNPSTPVSWLKVSTVAGFGWVPIYQ